MQQHQPWKQRCRSRSLTVTAGYQNHSQSAFKRFNKKGKKSATLPLPLPPFRPAQNTDQSDASKLQPNLPSPFSTPTSSRPRLQFGQSESQESQQGNLSQTTPAFAQNLRSEVQPASQRRLLFQPFSSGSRDTVGLNLSGAQQQSLLDGADDDDDWIPPFVLEKAKGRRQSSGNANASPRKLQSTGTPDGLAVPANNQQSPSTSLQRPAHFNNNLMTSQPPDDSSKPAEVAAKARVGTPAKSPYKSADVQPALGQQGNHNAKDIQSNQSGTPAVTLFNGLANAKQKSSLIAKADLFSRTEQNSNLAGSQSITESISGTVAGQQHSPDNSTTPVGRQLKTDSDKPNLHNVSAQNNNAAGNKRVANATSAALQASTDNLVSKSAGRPTSMESALSQPQASKAGSEEVPESISGAPVDELSVFWLLEDDTRYADLTSILLAVDQLLSAFHSKGRKVSLHIYGHTSVMSQAVPSTILQTLGLASMQGSTLSQVLSHFGIQSTSHLGSSPHGGLLMAASILSYAANKAIVNTQEHTKYIPSSASMGGADLASVSANISNSEHSTLPSVSMPAAQSSDTTNPAHTTSFMSNNTAKSAAPASTDFGICCLLSSPHPAVLHAMQACTAFGIQTWQLSPETSASATLPSTIDSSATDVSVPLAPPNSQAAQQVNLLNDRSDAASLSHDSSIYQSAASAMTPSAATAVSASPPPPAAASSSTAPAFATSTTSSTSAAASATASSNPASNRNSTSSAPPSASTPSMMLSAAKPSPDGAPVPQAHAASHPLPKKQSIPSVPSSASIDNSRASSPANTLNSSVSSSARTLNFGSPGGPAVPPAAASRPSIGAAAAAALSDAAAAYSSTPVKTAGSSAVGGTAKGQSMPMQPAGSVGVEGTVRGQSKSRSPSKASKVTNSATTDASKSRDVAASATTIAESSMVTTDSTVATAGTSNVTKAGKGAVQASQANATINGPSANDKGTTLAAIGFQSAGNDDGSLRDVYPDATAGNRTDDSQDAQSQTTIPSAPSQSQSASGPVTPRSIAKRLQRSKAKALQKKFAFDHDIDFGPAYYVTPEPLSDDIDSDLWNIDPNMSLDSLLGTGNEDTSGTDDDWLENSEFDFLDTDQSVPAAVPSPPSNSTAMIDGDGSDMGGNSTAAIAGDGSDMISSYPTNKKRKQRGRVKLGA